MIKLYWSDKSYLGNNKSCGILIIKYFRIDKSSIGNNKSCIEIQNELLILDKFLDKKHTTIYYYFGTEGVRVLHVYYISIKKSLLCKFIIRYGGT
jgi:hypothetical protein